MNADATILGLRENWAQFTLLVLINGFVGGMVGLERTILPKIAEEEYHLVATSAVLSFIIVFGVVKALTNFFAGALANRVGRKNLLVTGWLFALPIPFILIYAPSWNWVVFANVFLGINQGLCWTCTVLMKIDLVGEKNRGLAMGLNESAGYLAVALIAFSTGWIAANYGLKPLPFYLGVGLSIFGLLTSWLLVKDTTHHVAKESESSQAASLRNIFWETTWSHKNLGSVTQAGMVNNLNDGMIWGLFPILLAAQGFDLAQIAYIVAVYPAVWGLGQLITGKVADHANKKTMLFWGMLLQGIALLLMTWASTFNQFIVLSTILGVGTAAVYPTFLATIADFTHPNQRAESIGVFRLWRDLGYAVGAVLTGLISDYFGISQSILVIGGLTVISAIIIEYRMTSGEISDHVKAGR